MKNGFLETFAIFAAYFSNLNCFMGLYINLATVYVKLILQHKLYP